MRILISRVYSYLLWNASLWVKNTSDVSVSQKKCFWDVSYFFLVCIVRLGSTDQELIKRISYILIISTNFCTKPQLHTAILHSLRYWRKRSAVYAKVALHSEVVAYSVSTVRSRLISRSNACCFNQTPCCHGRHFSSRRP